MKARKHIVGNKVEEKKFVDAYVANGGNATEAIIATGKKIKRASSARRGSDLLKRKDIQLQIQDALEATGIDYKYVLDARKEVVQQGRNHLKGKRKDRELLVTPKDIHSHLMGIETVLGRIGESGLNTNKSQHLHLHLEEKSQKELLEKRQELSSWFTDVIEGDQGT